MDICQDPSVEATSLRAVHTAAGRLDTMWRDEEVVGWSREVGVSMAVPPNHLFQ